MILVTGGTGTVGREVVAQLLAKGEKFRILTRSPAKAEHLKGKVEIAEGDLDKAETLPAAMQGVDHLFLLTVDQVTVSDSNVIQAAKAAGVKHVVKISTNFVENDPQTGVGRWHAEKEKLLKASGLAWTILRPGAFMSNTLNWAGSIKSQGAVYNSAGESKSAAIDPADIAAVAVEALTKPGHEGKAYDLTGSEMLTYKEQVAILAEVIGKPIKTVDISVEAALEGMRKYRQMGPALEQGMREMLTAIAAGQLTRTVTQDVFTVTGKQPRTFKVWCEAHKAAFV
jgi:uncharacterized protein YbjT (DUF2867 family)